MFIYAYWHAGNVVHDLENDVILPTASSIAREKIE